MSVTAKAKSAGYSVMLARYEGICLGCKKLVYRGNMIALHKDVTGVWHVACAPSKTDLQRKLK